MNILSYPKFIRPVISFFLCIISIFLSLGDKPIIPHGKEIDMSKFELTWADEFDGDSLDLSKWGAHYFNNGETAVRRGGYWDLKLATVADGNLHIAAFVGLLFNLHLGSPCLLFSARACAPSLKGFEIKIEYIKNYELRQ